MNSPRPRPLEDSLLQGIRAARDLGPATDALTETLAHIERNLRELAWGVEVSVPLDGFPDSALRFGKSGSNWALEVTRPGTPPIPLVNSSRGARVAAVDALPALIQALAEGTEEEAQRVLLAASRAAGHRSWLETLPRR